VKKTKPNFSSQSVLSKLSSIPFHSVQFTCSVQSFSLLNYLKTPITFYDIDRYKITGTTVVTKTQMHS